MKSRKNTLRYIGAAAVALIAAVAANGITASNTISGSPRAGAGNTAISGYTVSGVSYTLNATNPGNVDSVALTLDAAASTVKIKLVAASSTWYSCTNPANNDWTCNTTSPQASVSTADQLDVVAAA